MNQEIKVTKCIQCPMLVIDGDCNEYYTCIKDAFYGVESYDNVKALQTSIHPNCPLKGKSITYKIGENE